MILVWKSLGLFVLAGFCEIGGGYLVWQWWRNGATWFVGVLGAMVLILYRVHLTQGEFYLGIVPSWVPEYGHPRGSCDLLQ